MSPNMFEPETESLTKDWRTPSLALAAWLLYCDHDIIRVDQNEYDQVYWVFANTENLQEDVMLFSSGDATCEPHEYYGLVQQARKEMPKFKRKTTRKSKTA